MLLQIEILYEVVRVKTILKRLIIFKKQDQLEALKNFDTFFGFKISDNISYTVQN